MPDKDTPLHPIVIIGAGPSGAIAAALLHRQGHRVLILERQRFPRFSIGESLLAHCLDFVEEAGMLPAVEAAGFQLKNGAAFACDGRYTAFDFGQTSSKGRPTTFQVQRARFDKLLADEAERQGVEIRYEEEIIQADFSGQPQLRVRRADGSEYLQKACFVLDASGYGRVLPRLLDLEAPSAFTLRRAVFTHVEDRIEPGSGFDRNKILITTHPVHRDVWFWTIPFSDGRCSQGVVAAEHHYEGRLDDLDACLKGFIAQTPDLAEVLQNAVWDTPARTIGGYSANVKALHGQGFALLGNAAEFLDPVFSSGVTIAMRSASMAAALLGRQLAGEAVNWESQFAQPLKRGVDAFRAYVEGWYEGYFQDVIYYPDAQQDIREMICSILAGYAWDERNPFVKEPARRLRMLAAVCQGQLA